MAGGSGCCAPSPADSGLGHAQITAKHRNSQLEANTTIRDLTHNERQRSAKSRYLPPRGINPTASPHPALLLFASWFFVRVTHLFPLVTENTPAATMHTALQLPQHLLPDKHFSPLLNYFITQSARYAAPAQGFVAKPALAKPEGLSLNPRLFINAMPRSRLS